MLVAQFAGLFLRALRLRLILLAAGPVLIGAMLAYVSSLSLGADQGVNIGEGLLVLWLLVSVALAFLAVLLEAVRALRSGG